MGDTLCFVAFFKGCFVEDFFKMKEVFSQIGVILGEGFAFLVVELEARLETE